MPDHPLPAASPTSPPTPPTVTLSIGALGRSVASSRGWTPLDLGPRHPSRAGLLLVDVSLDADGIIRSADVRPGHAHRAAEKLFEVRDYRQVLMLADRHDWSASVHGELVVAAAAESLLGLPVPERAVVVRELLAAHARIASHLGFLQFLPWRAGDAELDAAVGRRRDQARELLLALTGNRLHPMVVRLGGVAADPSPEWLEDAVRWAESCGDLSADLLAHATRPNGLVPGVGVVPAAEVDPLGLSGPVSAASGLDRAVHRVPRRPEPAAGDAASRFAALALDLQDAAREFAELFTVVGQTTGPVETPLSKIVKVPEGEVFVDRDAPLGITGVHLMSRAGTTPWRLRLRTPTFANVRALHTALVGVPLAQADVVVASLGYTIGDLDK